MPISFGLVDKSHLFGDRDEGEGEDGVNCGVAPETEKAGMMRVASKK